VDTRYTLLRLRPNLRQSWVALSVAHYLNKNLPEAKRILEHYIHTLKNVPDKDIEHSETLLYYITLLEDSEEYTEALKVLDTNSKARAILDKTAIHETRGALYLYCASGTP
jgi:N-alpha-acetyltransferase 15/16, NatA auxiliary subunit